MEELQLFRGDTVLIKGKKRRDTVSKLYDTSYLETTTAVCWTLLYLRNVKREICSYFCSSPSIFFSEISLLSAHLNCPACRRNLYNFVVTLSPHLTGFFLCQVLIG